MRLRRWNLAAPPAPSGFAGTPLLSPVAFGFPSPACAFAVNPPARVAERSATSFRLLAGSSACASEPITLRPAVAGAPCLTLRRLGALGVLRRSTGRVSRRSPRASADEALQLPIGLPLLPGNFRPFASLKPLPWFRHLQTCVSRHLPPGSLRLREPLAGWNFLVSGSLRLAPRYPPAPSGSCHRARLRVVTFPTLALEARPPRERDFRPSSSSDPRVAALGPVDWVAILGHSPYPRNNV